MAENKKLRSRDTAGPNSLLRKIIEIPTEDEDLRLIRAAKRGSLAARNELIVRHLPAMIQFAGVHYKERGCPPHVEVEDLIHVCVFGMVHAIRKYDLAKARGRFIGYARYWMRNYIDKAIDEYRLYRVPPSTKFAYDHGYLKNPATQMAIAHYHDIGFMQDDTSALDSRMTPEEHAIFNEELHRAKLRSEATARRTECLIDTLLPRKPAPKTGGSHARKNNKRTKRTAG